MTLEAVDFQVNQKSLSEILSGLKDLYKISPERLSEFGDIQNDINSMNMVKRDLDTYNEQRKDAVRSSIILAAIILGISLIEIFLMIRSSFLSRIKEIGVLRAIGVKKSDIYRMFIGEIFAITTIANVPGILLMTYILYNVSKISHFKGMFVVDFNTFILSIIIVYLFNNLIYFKQ